jgi:putative DNA primase/helicase
MKSHPLHRSVDFHAINTDAQPHILAVARSLALNGKIIGNEYVAMNPRRNDTRLGSFKINIRTGRWSDFAADARGGDVISYVAYLRNCSQIEAAKWLASWLGIGGGIDD